MMWDIVRSAIRSITQIIIPPALGRPCSSNLEIMTPTMEITGFIIACTDIPIMGIVSYTIRIIFRYKTVDSTI